MSYPGGKSGAGVYQTIINLMPPHSTYIEPFLGGGAIMRLKRPASLNIGLDLDHEVIRRWQYYAGPGDTSRNAGRRPPAMAPLAGHGEDLIASRGDTSGKYSRAKRGDGVPRAAMAPLAVRGDSGSHHRSPEAPVFRFRVGDGIDFLRSFPWTGNELVYCDPPYLASTRSCSHRHMYRYELEESRHVELLEVLNRVNCRVMVSGYSSTLYAKHLRNWNASAFQAATRGRPAAEWLWYNFDRPIELHDYRYLGADYRERERIKRKTTRWVQRLAKMPIIERQALLAAIGSGLAGNGETGPCPTAIPAEGRSRRAHFRPIPSIRQVEASADIA